MKAATFCCPQEATPGGSTASHCCGHHSETRARGRVGLSSQPVSHTARLRHLGHVTPTRRQLDVWPGHGHHARASQIKDNRDCCAYRDGQVSGCWTVAAFASPVTSVINHHHHYIWPALHFSSLAVWFNDSAELNPPDNVVSRRQAVDRTKQIVVESYSFTHGQVRSVINLASSYTFQFRCTH